METENKGEHHNCVIKLRENPQRRKDKVYVGCGAGFGGDRTLAALKLLQRVKELDYLVLECLAERTLAERFQLMMSGGKGYDPRISEWMSCLLPLAMERGVCIITNMGAMDPLGAQQEVVNTASGLGLDITIAVAYEVSLSKPESCQLSEGSMDGGASTYLGAAPIVNCLERYKPHVVITSRVADAALFLAPMVYELGWNWNDFEKLAQGALAGHLLECGGQLTGGYFMHPGDKYRDFSFEQILDISLPFVEVSSEGEICVAKADQSGGVLDLSTCAEQLLYEVGDPGSYITPDVVIDFCDVYFSPLSSDRVRCHGAKPSDNCYPVHLLKLVPVDCGWKAWGEISYGGYGCLKRAEAAEFLVRSWMDESCPGVNDCVVSYIIGHDSLKAITASESTSSVKQLLDIRFRMDGLFQLKEHALSFVEEFTALYTNGPAGGGGICTGHKKEIILQKVLVERENVFWQTEVRQTKLACLCNRDIVFDNLHQSKITNKQQKPLTISKCRYDVNMKASAPATAAPSGVNIPLYQVAHSRAGDKANDLNLSIVPHFSGDIERLKMVITPDWVKRMVSPLLDVTSFPDTEASKRRSNMTENVTVEIYEARGIHSLNVLIRNILDGGVNCSRRIDRHGKTVSDLILCQEIVLPP